MWFGNGRIRDLAKACKHLNIKKPLLVTDKDLVKSKMILNAVESNKKDSLIQIRKKNKWIFEDKMNVISNLLSNKYQ